MNYRTLFLKTYVAFLMTLVLVSVSFANVTVSGTTTDEEPTQGEITSFGFNNPTLITGQVIKRLNDGSFTANTSLARPAEHQLVFDIRDIDGFDHLDVYVVLFKSDTKVLGTSGLAIQYLNSGVSDNAFVIRWLSPERSTYLSGLTQLQDSPDEFAYDITTGQDNFLVKSGTDPLLNTYNSGLNNFFTPAVFNDQATVSWRVDLNSGLTSTEVESGVVRQFNSSNAEISSGTRVIKRQVTIPLTISKVLPQSGVLNYAVIAYDRLQQETTTSKTGDVNIVYADNGTPYVVEFYGEITINTSPATVVFSDVTAGSGFFQESVGIIEATFISNNIYKQSFSSDTTWLPNFVTDGLPEFAYLVPASGLLSSINLLTRDPGGHLATQGNRFALRAFRETIALGGNGATSPVDVRLIANDAAGFDQIISSSSGVYAQPPRSSYTAKPSLDALIAQADPTNELGVASTFRFEIKLSPVFQTNYILNGVVQTTQYTGTIRLLISNG